MESAAHIPHVRLTSSAGATLEARLVCMGDHYGPDERLVHANVKPLVEFSVPAGRTLRHVAVYQLEELQRLASRHDGFAPGGKQALALTAAECERLRSWIDNPQGAASETFSAYIVGADETVRRIALALKHLRLQTRMVDDGVRALAEISALPPSLVVVDADGVIRMPGIELVKRLRSGPTTRDVPLIVTASDPGAFEAVDADAILESPINANALVAAAAEALELL